MTSLLVEALHCRNENRPPVWLMRQAGRYMPEYRKMRAKHSFLEMCHTPEMAASVTLLPIQVFGMDAAILFSDILFVLEALGAGLRFEDSLGPIIERKVSTEKDVEALPKVDVNQSLGFVKETIKLLIPELKVPLIGFAGAPFTLASYLIEGGTTKSFKKTKEWMLSDPQSFHRLLEVISDVVISYLQMQVESGVHAVQIFDSWAGVLGYAQFQEFSLPYLAKIQKSLESSKIPTIMFCRGSSVFAPEIASLKPHAVSLDWNGDLAHLRRSLPAGIALQGNLDPDVLYAPLPMLQTQVKRMLKSMKGDPGYIFNLGHGIAPDVSPDAVKTLVDTIKNG